ncbi:uncharacterized protein LOC120845332 [Ixodes scapularis]|uniref:uncharacterized protein LOC120845332 n=1 Tax=Ixodes scapularis TaxID=6945 RepID=UPI001A9EB207|nr:uncharacterized protein LOC120845332 [Ixodes scapularis]
MLAEQFGEHNLAVANDGSPTFFRPPCTFSAIDVTAHSPEIPLSWRVAADTMGSDHFPVFIDIIGLQRPGVHEISVIHWDRFRDNLGRSTRPLLEAISDAAKEATIKASVPTSFPAPDLTLLNLCAARRRAQRLLQRKGGVTFKTLFNRIDAALRRYAKKCFKRQWDLICSSVDATTPARRIWRLMDSLSGKRMYSLPFAYLALCTGKLQAALAEDVATLYAAAVSQPKSRLSAQDSILDIVSAVQHAAASRKSTVAAFFDIQAAFDNVEPASVLAQLTSWGITGRVQGFLEGFLSDRSIQVKLSNTLSQSRPLQRGLPQGSVLSPLLFNIAIAGLPAALPNSRIPIGISMYADDLCIWVSGFRHPTLRAIMQSAINKIQAFLENQGLSISGHKAAAMVFPGRNRLLREVKLQLDSQPLRLVSKHRFLGITLQNRCKWHDQIKAVTASTISSRNAVRRVGGQNWGNSPRSMLTLHSSLVVIRLMYSLPYMDLLPSQADKLERLHRAGLRTSLGVPRSAKNERVYEEARSLPLHLQASQRLLLQVIRLGETHPGQSLIKRLRTRTQSKLSLATKTLAALGWEPPQIINPHGRTPPWEAGLQLAELLPGVRKKANTPPLVLKAAAQEQLAARYPRHLHIYTDGSVDRSRQSSTAAYHIPDLQKDWSARTTHMVSSTTAELLAIAEALTATKSLPPQLIVVLTDSRGGIQRIRKPGPCPTANEVAALVYSLEEGELCKQQNNPVYSKNCKSEKKGGLVLSEKDMIREKKGNHWGEESEIRHACSWWDGLWPDAEHLGDKQKKTNVDAAQATKQQLHQDFVSRDLQTTNLGAVPATIQQRDCKGSFTHL